MVLLIHIIHGHIADEDDLNLPPISFVREIYDIKSPEILMPNSNAGVVHGDKYVDVIIRVKSARDKYSCVMGIHEMI